MEGPVYIGRRIGLVGRVSRSLSLSLMQTHTVDRRTEMPVM